MNQWTAHMIKTEIGLPGEAFNVIVGLESRGFIQGTILSQMFGVPFVPVRKAGKLPGECYSITYGTEYSQDKCEIQKDGLKPGSKALLVDDLLATGGTLKATEDLISQVEGAEVAASYCIFDIPALGGSKLLAKKCVCLVSLED